MATRLWVLLALGIARTTESMSMYSSTGSVIPEPPMEFEPRYLFFDCDDCLYQNDWKTAKKLTKKIAQYTFKLGVGEERAYELYKKHGTCLKGLLAECLLPRQDIEDFLTEVHNIDYSDIEEDKVLRELLSKCKRKQDRYVFTASAREHADRCLKKIGIADLFYSIIDTRVCCLETKHSVPAFESAMIAAGCAEPRECVLFDDSVKNIKMAKRMGWTTVLVGLRERDTGKLFTCEEADHHIESLHDLPRVMPGLFPRWTGPFPTKPVKPANPHPRLDGGYND